MTSKKKKRRMRKIGRILAYAVMIGAIIVGGIAGWKLYSGLHDNHAAEETYEDLSDHVTTETNEDDNQPETVVDFDALSAINPDIAGWIHLDDSSIDYPFVYAADNDYYLEHTFDLAENHHGTIFIDARQTDPFNDTNTVLYGHHMFDGSMFADVENYKDADYYQTHKVILIKTRDASYYFYPVAGRLFSGSTDYIQFNFADEDDFNSYVKQFTDQSTFQSQETLLYGNKLMTLSTCSYDFDDARYVLIGKLVKRVKLDDGTN